MLFVHTSDANKFKIKTRSLQAKATTNSTSTPLTPGANNVHGSNDDVFDDIQVRLVHLLTYPQSQVMVLV